VTIIAVSLKHNNKAADSDNENGKRCSATAEREKITRIHWAHTAGAKQKCGAQWLNYEGGCIVSASIVSLSRADPG